MSPDLPIKEQRELAYAMFPQEWARAVGITGARGQKARTHLRKRAVYETAMVPLRAAGAACGTCQHFRRVPGPGPKQNCCDLDSDSGGYAIRSANDLCPAYKGPRS